MAQAMVEPGEFADLMHALHRMLDDPGTLVLSHLFVQACGGTPR